MRSIIISVLFIVISITTLSGCTSLETLKRTEPRGDKFQTVLLEHYRQFATEEAQGYDWIDSQHFINKAMLAAYGSNPEPEYLDDWHLPPVHIPEFESARAALMTLLTNFRLRLAHPEKLALAQFYFDCWIEQQEENWQEDDIRKCRNGFYENINTLQDIAPRLEASSVEEKPIKKPILAAKKKVKKPAAKKSKLSLKPKKGNKTEKVMKEAPSTVKVKKNNKAKDNAGPTKKHYTLHFMPKNTTLAPEHRIELSTLLTFLQSAPRYKIMINAYTDTYETEEKNLRISKQRIAEVKKLLAKHKIDSQRIISYAYGEAAENIKSFTPSESGPLVEITLTNIK